MSIKLEHELTPPDNSDPDLTKAVNMAMIHLSETAEQLGIRIDHVEFTVTDPSKTLSYMYENLPVGDLN